MNQGQKQLIKQNLVELIKLTSCDKPLLDFLLSKGIFSDEDIQEIEAKKEKPYKKSSEFYKVIQTKSEAFDFLLEGLVKCFQTGAVSLLAGKPGVKLKLDEAKVLVNKRLAEIHPSLSKLPLGKISNTTFDVISPAYLFTGRTKEVDDLHGMILRENGEENVTVISQLTTVTGLGGIGKTQLARRYISQKDKEFDGNVLWIKAEDERSILNSFHRLATEKLQLSTKDGNGNEKSIKAVAEDVYKYFEGCRALFVFDNADSATLLRDLLPAPTQNPNLYALITSRNQEWQSGVNILTLGVLLKEEAVLMVKKGLKIDNKDSDEVINELVSLLQCFPLALQQAIAFISNEEKMDSYTIKDYIQQFEAEKKEMLDFSSEILDDDYIKTTRTTWKITVDKIKADQKHGDTAVKLLSIMAFLQPDYIKRDLFFSHFVTPGNEKIIQRVVKQAVKLLVKYSMINGGDRQRILSVHRLVQEVTRIELGDGCENTEKTILNVALSLLCSMDEDFPVDNIEHAMNAWKYVWKYPIGIIIFHTHHIFKILAKTYRLGMHDQGIHFGKYILSNFKHFMGKNNIPCLIIKLKLATILGGKGQYEKAVLKLKKIIKQIEAFEPESIGIVNFRKNEHLLEAKHHLSTFLMNWGKIDESVQVSKEIGEQAKNDPNSNFIDILGAQCQRASALIGLGKDGPNKAIKIFDSILQNSVVLSENMVVLYTKKEKARAYEALCEYDKACKIYEEIYPQMLSTWRDYVDLFSEVCCEYGNLLVHNEEIEIGKVLEYLKENYKRIVEFHGKENPKTLCLLKLLGDAYNREKNFQLAFETHEKAYKGIASILGDNHVDTLIYTCRIAEDLSYLGRHKRSLNMYQDVLNQLEKILPQKHTKLYYVKVAYANALEAAGDLDSAMQELKTLLEDMQNWIGKDHLRYKSTYQKLKDVYNKIMKTKLELATIYKNKGNFSNALKMLMEAYQMINSKSRELVDVPAFFELCTNLGEILNELGEHTKALQVVEEVSISIEDMYKDDNYLKLSLQVTKATAYRGLGEVSKALSMHNKVYQIIKTNKNHGKFLLLVMTQIAIDLSYLGKHKQAIKTFRKAHDKMEQESDMHELLRMQMFFADAIERSGTNLIYALRLLNYVRNKMEEWFDKDSPLIKRVDEAYDRINAKIEIAYD